MSNQETITVYTPTFNRAYCLPQLYNSLLNQTVNDFVWLIIDDGSTDNTEEIVKIWIKQSPFKILYFKQINEGKMEKVNFAHQFIDTELNMCVDSDDYLLNDSIEIILKEWEKIKFNQNIAGMVGLDVFKDHTVVGTKFPENISISKFCYFDKIGAKGDKKFIYRSEITKKYPKYPSINGEKFPAPGYLYRLIDVDYNLWVFNKPLCVVEYLEDGLSKNKFKQFKMSPNSFVFYRQERMRLAINWIDRFKNAIHYVSSCMFANKKFFEDNLYPITTILAIPFGILLNNYIKRTNKRGVV